LGDIWNKNIHQQEADNDLFLSYSGQTYVSHDSSESSIEFDQNKKFISCYILTNHVTIHFRGKWV